jgi:hypothetical protein
MNSNVTDLNAALENHPELDSGNSQELLANIESVPDEIRTAVSGGPIIGGVRADRCGDPRSGHRLRLHPVPGQQRRRKRSSP